MDLTENQLYRSVERRVAPDIMNECVNKIFSKGINLWGHNNGDRNFVKFVTYLAVYKDLHNLSYKNLAQSVSLGDKTLRVNQSKVRNKLKNWAKKQIRVGNANEWDKAIRRKRLGKRIKDVNLMIDSTDFKSRGKNFLGIHTRLS